MTDPSDQAALEQQLTDLAMVDGEALDVLMRLGQAVFPDAATLADSRSTVWPERDRSAPTPRVATVTDPLDLQALIDRSESRFLSLVSQLPAVVFLAALGEGENEVYVSPHIEQLLGFTAAEWLSDPLLWYRQLHPDDHDGLIAAFTRGVQSGGVFRAEVRFFARDGSVVWILGEARLIKDALGRPDFFQGVAFDISANKEAQELVSNAERARTEGLAAANEELTRINIELHQAKEAAEAATTSRETFLATMSHELRTPLNAVIALSGLLGRSDLSSDDAEMVRTMELSAGYLLTLISDILDFSRLRAGGVELDPRLFSLRVWMANSIGIARPRLEEKALELVVSADPEVPDFVVGDELRLQQILLNVLSNATKFTSQGRVAVHLAAEPVGSEWQLTCSVDDSGVGVAPEAIEALFDEFRQADAGVSRHHGGSGLGLAISKGLCALMGGRIWVEQSPLGGARFAFTWRASAGVASPVSFEPSVARHGAALGSSRHLRILVAEDNVVNTFVARRLLEHLGYEPTFVVDGFAAVAAVETHEFDVVLMDVSMPGLDGLAATRAIRERGDDLHQPFIVAVTANAMPKDRVECLAAGMDDFLSKPIDREALARVLSELHQRSVS